MNDDLAFIDAILKNEADDTARLVYADWLADHDEPELSAFVRLQTEVYRTPNSDPRRLDLRKQEETAWNAYKKKWKAALELGRIGRGHFTRGVMKNWQAQQFPAPEFVEQCGGWGPGVPVRRVHLDAGEPCARIDERLAACPFLARLTELVIGRRWVPDATPGEPNRMAAVSADAVIALARSPHAAQLRHLEISLVRPSRAMLAELAACPGLDAMSLVLRFVPWVGHPLRSFNKYGGRPLADAVDELLNGPDGEHLID